MAKRKISEDRQRELIDKALTIYLYHYDQYKDFCDQVKINNSMVRPDGQWDRDELEELHASDRAALTINKLLPYVLALMGMSVQSQSTHKVIGVNSKSDNGLAMLATRLLLHHYERSNYQDTKEFVRTDGVIGKIGLYRVKQTDSMDDSYQRVKIVRDDNLETWIDPDARDLFQSDWKYVVSSWWEDAESIVENYPKFIKPGDIDVNLVESRYKYLLSRLPNELRSWMGSRKIDYRSFISNSGMLRVVQVWSAKISTVKEYIDSTTGETIRDIDSIPEDMRGNYITNIVRKHVKEVITVLPYKDLLLDYEEVPMRYFPHVACIPLYIGGKIVDSVAWVEGMFGLQEELNRTRTAAADIAARGANGMVILPAGEDELKNEWIEHGSEHGVVLMKATQGAIEYPDSKLPTHHLQTLEINAKDWVETSGIPPAAFGVTGSDESGILYAQKIRQSSTTLAPMFANFSRAEKMLSCVLLEVLSKSLTVGDIQRILGEDYEEIETTYPGTVQKFLNDFSVQDYDIIVTETDYAQSVRQQKLKELQEVIKSVKSPELSEMLSLTWLSSLPIDESGDDVNIVDMVKKYLMAKYGNFAAANAPMMGGAGGQGGVQPGANQVLQGGLPPNQATGLS